LIRLIQEDVRSWTRFSEPMLRFVAESRDKIHKLAILSNMIPDTLVYLRRHCDWLGLFDELSFSCEIGANKPSPESYATCLERLQLSPGECLFVDDTAENVRGAREAGLSAIQFKSFPEFRQELDEKYCLIQ